MADGAVTALLEAPVAAPPAPPRPPLRVLLVVTGLLSAAVALLVVAGLQALQVRVDPVVPRFGGTAPYVDLPTYGVQGMHVVGYEHGASAQITLPVRNAGRLPMTVTSVSLGGGVAPLLEVQRVAGLPLRVGPGDTASVVVHAVLANCRFFHEREVQNYAAVELGLRVLGRDLVRSVPYDQPLMVHSPMIVGCPDRLLDRQAQDRSDLTRAG